MHRWDLVHWEKCRPSAMRHHWFWFIQINANVGLSLFIIPKKNSAMCDSVTVVKSKYLARNAEKEKNNLKKLPLFFGFLWETHNYLTILCKFSKQETYKVETVLEIRICGWIEYGSYTIFLVHILLSSHISDTALTD